MKDIDSAINVVIVVVAIVALAPTVISGLTSMDLHNLSFDGGTTTKDLSWVAYLGVLVFLVTFILGAVRYKRNN